MQFKFLTVLTLIFSFVSYANAELPTHAELKTQLTKIVKEKNGGFGLNMWVTVVDRDGVIKAVAFTGDDRGAQWPGSRAISAQKANTANAFSLPKLALSTANLFSAVQPGGSLYGLQHSNPVSTEVAYGGSPKNFGLENDPMVGKMIGGVNVFGGGLPIYSKEGTILGALGVSGDSSCADHNIAWKLRHSLELDYIPGGVGADKTDNIAYDISNSVSKGGWGHPSCSADAKAIAEKFSSTHPVRKMMAEKSK